MSKLLKNARDIDSLKKAVSECRDDVMVLSADQSEEYNLKSLFSEYVAIGKLASEHGDEYEFFCNNASDECRMLGFFDELRKTA